MANRVTRRQASRSLVISSEQPYSDDERPYNWSDALKMANDSPQPPRGSNQVTFSISHIRSSDYRAFPFFTYCSSNSIIFQEGANLWFPQFSVSLCTDLTLNPSELQAHCTLQVYIARLMWNCLTYGSFMLCNNNIWINCINTWIVETWYKNSLTFINGKL